MEWEPIVSAAVRIVFGVSIGLFLVGLVVAWRRSGKRLEEHRDLYVRRS